MSRSSYQDNMMYIKVRKELVYTRAAVSRDTRKLVRQWGMIITRLAASPPSPIPRHRILLESFSDTSPFTYTVHLTVLVSILKKWGLSVQRTAPSPVTSVIIHELMGASTKITKI